MRRKSGSSPSDTFRKSSRETARHFRRLYIIALGLIAGLAISAQVLVQRALISQHNGGHVVNEAGYQRMLSQRIALKIALYDEAQPDAPAQLRAIQALRDRWVAAHAALLLQVDEVGFDRAARAGLTNLFTNLHQPMQRMVATVDALVRNGTLTAVQRNAILTDQEIFLPLMDAVVLGFEQSVRSRVDFLQRLELGLFLLTLVVLAMEAVLIFRPAVRRLELSLKLLEQRGQQTAKRLESLRHLAGGIAHSFNNILTGIMGHAELQRYDAESRQQSTEYIDKQIEDCRRAADIVSQLLKYSGYGRFDCQPTALGAWLRGLAGALTPPNSPVTVAVEVVEDSMAAIDRKAIAQVVHGLTANAIEAMAGRSGQVVVQLLQVSLTKPRIMSGPYHTELPSGLYACLRVIDQGAGITAEELDHIFDPYHTRKEFGRGLGLAAILGVAHSHGGGIELESQPAQGSVATLYLPNIEVGAEQPLAPPTHA